MELMTENNVASVTDKIVDFIKGYFEGNGLSTDPTGGAVIGMSGGLDSTVCAALFQKAGIYTCGIVIPIHQNPHETMLGMNMAREYCNILEVKDLSPEFDMMAQSFIAPKKIVEFEKSSVTCIKCHEQGFYEDFHKSQNPSEYKTFKIRLGNIKARIRMMYLYHLASLHKGLVISTDNLSEYLQGFWTLHGDVGDLGPIQGIFKGLELPILAKHLGIPKHIIDQDPTDGLGISDTDYDQLGVKSYKDLDNILIKYLTMSERTSKGDSIIGRYHRTQFKRDNPINVSRTELGLDEIKIHPDTEKY